MASDSRSALRVQLLGPLTVIRDGQAVALPKSRKVRALIAYLALASRPLTRSHLCELLWDSPSDPRGELRWCLSRARSVLDESSQHRIVAEGDTVALDLRDCRIDALEMQRASAASLEPLGVADLQALADLFQGDFLDGIEIDTSPQFNHWVIGERRRFRAAHTAVLRELARKLPPEKSLGCLEKWVQLAPLDIVAHQLLLQTLVGSGRLREAEEHLAATIRLFEVEGLDWLPVREAWRSARQKEKVSAAVALVADTSERAAEPQRSATRRASIAVLPFLDKTSEEVKRSGLGDGLADDIITRLAKLRVLTVIARGSAFAMSDRNIGADEAGRLLRVDYIANGSVRRHGNRIVVTAELIETDTNRVAWANDFDRRAEDAFATLEEIGNSIVASIAEEIETVERNRAILKPPASLNAWEAYHRGLWHMYRFRNLDNEQAAHFFNRAIELDPTFSRAYSALSFTHFQNAFLHRPLERQKEIDLAYETAGQSASIDDRDPAAHLALGRALWLRGQQSESLSETQVSLDLSPNFALGHYTFGFVHCQSGDPQTAIDSAMHSQHLSPFDPLLFAMLTTRGIGHLRMGQYDIAADLTVKAAARPNAHEHIISFAATALAAAGRIEEARQHVVAIRKRLPGYTVEDFIAGFRFAPDVAQLFRQLGQRVGLDR